MFRGKLLVVLLLAAGCTHDRPLRIDLDESVVVPDRPVVVFFVDGLGYDAYHAALTEGRLPNIKKHLADRGVSVRHAFSCVPSITYAVMASFLTGLYPGHHGIVANRWFDPAAAEYRHYNFIKTYRMVGDDYSAPTLFELVQPGRRTVSIQLPNRRGVTRPIDNWMTSGLNWFFGGYREVDKLVAMRFELIAEEANAYGPWPDLIFAYFPGTDETGHRHGPDSAQHALSLANVDAQIGRICDGLDRAGLLERTTLVLISDHGIVPQGRCLEIAPLLRRTCGSLLPKVVDRVPQPTLAGEKWERVFDDAGAVVLSGGERRAAIYLRRGDDPWQSAGHQAGRAALAEEVCRRAGLADLPAVALLARWAGVDRVVVANGDGRAEILRDSDSTPTRFAYRPIEGDPLGYRDNAQAAPLIGGWHVGRDWLAATAETLFPDLVPQIVTLFDCDRSGDIQVFAAPGWGFQPGNRGGHGSVLAGEMRVPMVFAGPGIAEKATIRYARAVDVMPTILDLMGLGEHVARAGRLDGQSLAGQLVQAKQES